MVKTYDDFSASTKLESFVDYSKIKESTIEKISNLTEKENLEDTEDIEEKENKISHFDLVKVSEHQIVMIMVMEDGTVNSKNI